MFFEAYLIVNNQESQGFLVKTPEIQNLLEEMNGGLGAKQKGPGAAPSALGNFQDFSIKIKHF